MHDFLKVRTFRETAEFSLEQMLQVPGISSDEAVEASEPRATEEERAILRVKHSGDPFIYVLPEAKTQGRQHAQHWPNSEALSLNLPQRMYRHEDYHREKKLNCLNLWQWPSKAFCYGFKPEKGGLVA